MYKVALFFFDNLGQLILILFKLLVMSLEEYFGKKYHHVGNSENFDEYLKAIGVNFMFRKLSKIMPTSIVMNKKEKEYEVITYTPVNQNMIVKFIPGEETEYFTHSGQKIVSTPKVIGNIIEEKMFLNGKNILKSTIFKGNDLQLVFKVDDIEAAMFYKLDGNSEK